MNFNFTETEHELGSKQLYVLLFILITLTLFFIQALRSYVPGVYVAMFHVVFGHDVMNNFLIIITLLFYFFPVLLPSISKRFGIKKVMKFSLNFTVISRVLLALHFPNIWQVILSGLIILFYCFFMSSFLTLWFEEASTLKQDHKIIIVIFCILCAFYIDYSIRILGFTQDLTLLPPGIAADYWFLTQYIWLVILIPLSIMIIFHTRFNFLKFSDTSNKWDKKQAPVSSLYLLNFAGLGIFFFLMLNIFLYPNTIVLYTKTNYYFNVFINLIALLLSILIIFKFNRIILIKLNYIAIINCFMLISFFIIFFFENLISFFIYMLLLISLITIYVNFYILFSQMFFITFKWEKLKTISNIFAVSLTFYVLFLVLHILCTDWAYVLEILKGLGSFLVMMAGIIYTITTLISIQFNTKKGVENI